MSRCERVVASIGLGFDGAEAQRLLAHAAAHDALQADESAAADEENVGGVDGREFLVRMLAPALRRHVGHGALENLEQRLLHAFAGNVARNRGVLVLAADLVDLVDVDDALLRARYVAVCGLQQLENDVFDILAHVAGLGKRGRVHNGKRHIQHLGQRVRQQRFAASPWGR